MRVALIYNPKAGNQEPTGEDLSDLLRAAGHDVTRHSSKDDHLAAFLEEAPELVAIAGGDGTVAKVAKITMGRGIPLAVLPIGTANNISQTLGVAELPIDRQIAAWPRWRTTRLDIGLARGPWGSRHFVESVGIGLLAWSIPRADSSAMLDHIDGARRKLAYVRKMLCQDLRESPEVSCRATLDGEDISGDYVLLEAMNIRSIGPNLGLAPEADPGDGLLDVVAVSRDHAAELRKHFSGGAGRARRLPCLPSLRGRELRMEWSDFDLHFDDEIWPEVRPARSEARTIDIKLEHDAVEFLVPPAKRARPVRRRERRA